LKLIDAVVPAARVLKSAKGLDQAGGTAKAHGTGGFSAARRAGLFQGRHDDVPGANAIYRRETYDNYPARVPFCRPSMKGCNCPWIWRCA